MSKSNITINYVGFSNEDSVRMSLTVKESDNGGKTDFALADIAKVRLYGARHDYGVTSSKGTATKYSRGLIDSRVEEITFISKKESSLSEIPVSILNWSYLGNQGGSPLFNSDGSVIIPEAGIFVLRVEYTVNYDLLKVTSGGIDGTSLVVVKDEFGNLASTEISFGEVKSQFVRVVINVKDYCSDENVAGANINIKGNGVNLDGISDSVGIFDAGVMASGTYGLIITAQGFGNSDTDALHNDSFTIPMVKV